MKRIMTRDDMLRLIILGDEALEYETEDALIEETDEATYYLRLSFTSNNYLNQDVRTKQLVIDSKKETTRFKTEFTLDDMKHLSIETDLGSFTAEDTQTGEDTLVKDLLSLNLIKKQEEESDRLSDIAARLTLKEAMASQSGEQKEIEPEEFLAFLDGLSFNFLDSLKDN